MMKLRPPVRRQGCGNNYKLWSKATDCRALSEVSHIAFWLKRSILVASSPRPSNALTGRLTVNRRCGAACVHQLYGERNSFGDAARFDSTKGSFKRPHESMSEPSLSSQLWE